MRADDLIKKGEDILKANMIRNVEAYKAAFAREYEKDGIRIRMVIIQPVQL